MKFSTNPTTGLLEAHNDDGIYQGTIITMGDIIAAEEPDEEYPDPALEDGCGKAYLKHISKLDPGKVRTEDGSETGSKDDTKEQQLNS